MNIFDVLLSVHFLVKCQIIVTHSNDTALVKWIESLIRTGFPMFLTLSSHTSIIFRICVIENKLDFVLFCRSRDQKFVTSLVQSYHIAWHFSFNGYRQFRQLHMTRWPWMSYLTLTWCWSNSCLCMPSSTPRTPLMRKPQGEYKVTPWGSRKVTAIKKLKMILFTFSDSSVIQ